MAKNVLVILRLTVNPIETLKKLSKNQHLSLSFFSSTVRIVRFRRCVKLYEEKFP